MMRNLICRSKISESACVRAFFRRISGRHAITDIQVADDIDREPYFGPITLTNVGNGANAAFIIPEFRSTSMSASIVPSGYKIFAVPA